MGLAESALFKAYQQVGSLTKSDIAEIRSYSMPAPSVVLAFAAVMVCLGELKDWPSVRNFIGEEGFLERILTFNPDVSPQTITRI